MADPKLIKMDHYFSVLSNVYKDVGLEVRKKYRMYIHVNWLNSVNGRTLLYGTVGDTEEKVFLFIVSRDCNLLKLADKFTMEDIVPDGVDDDIRDADHLLFFQYRKEFNIKKSSSFRILGNAVYVNKKSGKSTVIQELAANCISELK